MERYLVVLTTFPERKKAESICKTLIREKIAACCQIFGIKSFYWWKEKIEESKEYLCLIKTEKSMFSKLKKRLISIHPYKVPEIVCLEAKYIEKKYAQWIKETIRRKNE